MIRLGPPPRGTASRPVRLAIVGGTLAAFDGFALALFLQLGGPMGAILSVVTAAGVVASVVGVVFAVQASRHAGRADVLAAIVAGGPDGPPAVVDDDSAIEDLIPPNGQGKAAS